MISVFLFFFFLFRRCRSIFVQCGKRRVLHRIERRSFLQRWWLHSTSRVPHISPPSPFSCTLNILQMGGEEVERGSILPPASFSCGSIFTQLLVMGRVHFLRLRVEYESGGVRVRTECESSSILGLTFKKSCFESNFNKYILIISSAREIKLDSKFIPQTRESFESAKECFEYESFEYEPRLDPSLPIAACALACQLPREKGRGRGGGTPPGWSLAQVVPMLV